MHGVSVTIPADKMERIWVTVAQFLEGAPLIDRQGLRSFAGLISWVANLCPQLHAFLRMIWAALASNQEMPTVYLK